MKAFVFGGALRELRSMVAAFSVMAIAIAVCLAISPYPAKAHTSQQHFSVGMNGPTSTINLGQFLQRLVTPHTINVPADLVNIPNDAFEDVFNTAGPGYTPDTVWYRAAFTVLDTDEGGQEKSYIEMGQPYLNDIKLAIIKEDTRAVIWRDRVGDRLPKGENDVRGLLHLSEWPELLPGDYWLTIAVKTNSAHIFQAQLVPETEQIANIGRNSFPKGIYLGILMVAFGVYLTLGVLSSDKAVTWYSAYIFSLFLINFGVSGYAHFLFTDLWYLTSDFLTGTGTAFAIATSVTMWSYIIELDRHNRWLHRVMTTYSFLAGLGFLTATTDAYITFAKLFFIPDVILLSTLLIYLVYLGIRQKKVLEHSFLMVALGVPTMAVIAHLLLLVGVIPVNAFTTSIYSASSVVHLTMIAIAMGLRTYKLSHRRMNAAASNQRASQLAGEQRAFITMLSHEFRTPLAIIQRSSEILGLHLSSEQDAVHNRLGTIRNNASQLSGLVDAFLTKDTLDSATFTTTREPVAIDAFLADLIARRHREVPGQNVNLINSEFAIVDIDRILLERAIVNLIENARKYAPGAAVWIACNRSANGYVYIRVVDEGPGIAAEDLSNVLNAFYRGREAAKTQGVGLGLHLTRRIVEAHDGSLSVNVGEKGGTTILIKLPFNKDATVLKTNDVLLRVMGGSRRKPSNRETDE